VIAGAKLAFDYYTCEVLRCTCEVLHIGDPDDFGWSPRSQAPQTLFCLSCAPWTDQPGNFDQGCAAFFTR